MPQLVARLPVSIVINTSLSVAVDLNGALLTIIEMPAAWDAANLTFQTAGIGGDFANVYDELGNEVSVIADVDRRIRLDATQWAGIFQLKIRSGTAGVPVNQTAARTLYVELWE